MSSQANSAGNILARIMGSPPGGSGAGKKLSWGRQLVLQLILLAIAFTVIFPILWIVSMALDPRNMARPTSLQLIPPGASLAAFQAVIAQPTNNKISFLGLAFNSLKLAGGTALGSLLVGVLDRKSVV